MATIVKATKISEYASLDSLALTDVMSVIRESIGKKKNYQATLATLLSLFQDEMLELDTWTPIVGFNSNGDYAATEHIVAADYLRILDFVLLSLTYEFTPTYTTSSSFFKVSGLPFMPSSNFAGFGKWRTSSGGAMVPNLPSSTYSPYAVINSANYLVMQASGDAVNATYDTTQITSGVRRHLTFNLWYKRAV